MLVCEFWMTFGCYLYNIARAPRGYFEDAGLFLGAVSMLLFMLLSLVVAVVTNLFVFESFIIKPTKCESQKISIFIHQLGDKDFKTEFYKRENS